MDEKPIDPDEKPVGAWEGWTLHEKVSQFFDPGTGFRSSAPICFPLFFLAFVYASWRDQEYFAAVCALVPVPSFVIWWFFFRVKHRND